MDTHMDTSMDTHMWMSIDGPDPRKVDTVG